jgi:hypothetical protein
MNHELYTMYQNPDLATIVKSHRLRWAGHVVRMEQNRYPKKVLEKKLDQKKAPGRPRKRWEDCVKEDVMKTGYKGDWKRKAGDRLEWSQVVEKAKALKGPR